ncbi:ABC transporter permease [uncultured Jannaschia sp.]|uniref:ABC transporter permease n=1 Tax=uncultured Jannaschia sp. TaxID=293347 RepID=UPI003447FB60
MVAFAFRRSAGGLTIHRYRFVLLRPLQFLPVLFGISVVTFVLVRLIPGDPARVLLGTRATPSAIANVRAQYGLDEPILTQYFYFLGNLANGEMGRSILYKIDVLRLIATRIEPTLALVVASVVLSVVIAVPMASIAARNQGRPADHAVRIVSTMGIGFPPFWLALMLIIFLSVRLSLFPVSGYGETWGEKLAHLALPSLTVALSLSAVLTRSLRAAMVQGLASDVATAARARGMPEGVVFRRHVLPNALVPTINLLAVNTGWLIGGTVVVESVFALPGLGQLLVRAIFSRDYMVVQGVAMTFACATVLVNFLADIATVAVDPRVKL